LNKEELEEEKKLSWKELKDKKKKKEKEKNQENDEKVNLVN
jgi:hypothetical protein